MTNCVQWPAPGTPGVGGMASAILGTVLIAWVLSSCAGNWPAEPIRAGQQFVAVPYPGPIRLHFEGTAGYADGDDSDGRVTRLGGTVGALPDPHVELFGRFSRGHGDPDSSLPGDRLDATNTFLDIGLRGLIRPGSSVNPYVEASLGYGFLDPASDSADTAEGPSWRFGAGIEHPLTHWFLIAAGVDYRTTSWHADFDPDFRQQEFAVRIELLIHLGRRD